jgi:hypothetical protein
MPTSVGPAIDAILRDAARDDDFSHRELAERVYGVAEPSSAQLAAVRRAVLRLERAGVAELVPRGARRNGRPGAPPRAVRRTRTFWDDSTESLDDFNRQLAARRTRTSAHRKVLDMTADALVRIHNRLRREGKTLT